MNNKQITITLKVSPNTIEEMKEFLNDSIREKTPPYAIFQADDCDTVITVYQSGKAVFQGKDADLSSSFWIEREKYLNPSKELETTNSQDKVKEDKKDDNPLKLRINSIGSDEVGTGDFFGPIVVTATYVSKENIDFLLELKVKDSKKMSDKDIIKVVPEIIKKIPYHTYILSNSEYNKVYGTDMNMNKMKAVLHNKVLNEFTKDNKYQYDYVVIDQFEVPKSYYNHIKGAINNVGKITFLTKAEDKCLSVACASLISRYIFLSQMNKLSKEVGFTLPKGAGPLVDDAAKKIVNMYGIDKLKSIAKLNFNNYKKLTEK